MGKRSARKIERALGLGNPRSFINLDYINQGIHSLAGYLDFIVQVLHIYIDAIFRNCLFQEKKKKKKLYPCADIPL